MNRQVIVLTDAKAEPVGELFEILSAAGISFLTEDWREARSSAASTWTDSNPNSWQPLAVIYEVRADSNAEELALAIRCATTEWPSVPIVACRLEPTERPKRGAILPTADQLRRLGVRAIADSPAQLPALLRQVEEIPGTGELRTPNTFRSIPESGAFSLPTHARSEDLRIAFALLASLHLASNQKEAAQSALIGIARLINANRWSIFLVSQASTENLTFAPLASGDVAANGELAFDEELRDELLDGLGQPVKAETRATREAAAIMKAVRTSENGRRVMAVPLISGERVLGVLEGVRSSADRRSFSRSETALLEALAISIAAALANSVRIAEAERLSLTDDLTRLHNARYLRQFLVNEIKRARRYSSSVAAVFLDLDDFKLVNDKHGHLVGSHVLMEVAALLLPSVRDTDCVVRYGGDEFLLILPDARLDDAIQVAERTRARIERHRFNGGRRLKVSLTASLGVAAFPQHALSPQQLIACADRAMYHAKAANKNCVWVVNDSTTAHPSDHPDANPTVPAQFQRIPDEKLIS
jgi:diguanylate cyclase (GGDEF)-like protein